LMNCVCKHLFLFSASSVLRPSLSRGL
jgi:hypothetical protein